MQSHGVLTKGIGVNQIYHKKETFWNSQDKARNIKLSRTIKQANLLWSKIIRKL